MPSSWFGKKDAGDADPSAGGEAASGEPKEEWQQLTDDLRKLEKLLTQAGDRIAAYLRRRESQSLTAAEALAQALDVKIAALAEKLDGLESRLAGRLQDQIQEGFNNLAGPKSPETEPSRQTSAPQGNAAWESAILGPDLAEHPHLAFQRRQLLDGVLEGDASARSLAGQLLVFQSAPADRLPKLLKEIGEAYYRWQPKTAPGTNRLEQSLVQWLGKTCEAAGISNTIELVHPGERFDAARHNAASRGVEITEVHGWIVLRSGGKVYTKANVAVK